MNALHSSIDFQPRPVSHAPTPFGFGFGLGQAPSPAMSFGWQPVVTPVSPFSQNNHSLPQQSPSRSQKRGREPEESADEAMERSPTPDRPKRAPPKRARQHEPPKAPGSSKENKAPSSEDNDVDIGVLLASLPTQSLLPLLNSLISAQPSLKTTILPLIPRPTIQIALQALADSIKKLHNAYPYSHSMQAPSSSSIGFGFGSASRISAFGQNNSFGKSAFSETQSNTPAMRDEYIVSRIRPYVTEFVSAVMSYLPYFSQCISPTDSSNVDSHQSTTLRGLHRGKSQPSETFAYLETVTSHLVNQPPLAVSLLVPLLLPRLEEEWKAWVLRVDAIVNQEGGMFGRETSSWERSLDQFAQCKDVQCASAMVSVRDIWVAKVGWLVGRSVQHRMDL